MDTKVEYALSEKAEQIAENRSWHISRLTNADVNFVILGELIWEALKEAYEEGKNGR